MNAAEVTSHCIEIEVTRTYLQMEAREEMEVAKCDLPGLRLERVGFCPGSFFRYLYREVGRNYHWVDRLAWTDEEARAYLDDPQVTLWVLYSDGAPAGYYELRQHAADHSVEIAYFGLLPEFHGRGLGKHLLTCALEAAWDLEPRRVWLHTCSLDDPAALSNYCKRGLKPYREEKYTTGIATVIPDQD